MKCWRRQQVEVPAVKCRVRYHRATSPRPLQRPKEFVVPRHLSRLSSRRSQPMPATDRKCHVHPFLPHLKRSFAFFSSSSSALLTEVFWRCDVVEILHRSSETYKPELSSTGEKYESATTQFDDRCGDCHSDLGIYYPGLFRERR